MLKSNIYIGPAGWSYPDWRGVVYPHKKPRDFSELGYISKYFNTVEINSSFYKIPTLITVRRWLAQVSARDDFKFCVKLWNRYTHTEFPIEPSETKQFKDILGAIAAEDKLGAVLIQFPWRFKKSKSTVEYLFQIVDMFGEYPSAIEFRHSSWIDASVQDSLKERNVAFVNIDQPVIGESIAPSEIVTSHIGYVRFHGRNSDAWFAENAGRNERYNYLYNSDELGSWSEPIENMSSEAETMFLIFNNHFRGKALINAFELMFEINKQKPLAPKSLLLHYPDAEKFAIADTFGQTMQLF